MGPVSYKENQKHLISGIFVFLSHFIAFSAKKITAESKKRERSESVIKTSISIGLGVRKKSRLVVYGVVLDDIWLSALSQV
jgi:hypothetical protein